MKAIFDRLFPWRDLEREVQRLDERMATRLDHVVQSVMGEFERQRSQADALAVRHEQSRAEFERHIADAISAPRPRRLFISTGFFATAMAAAIVRQQGRVFDDYLLVTLDRQSGEDNCRWAFQLNDDWAAVRTVGHSEYYERTETCASLLFSDLRFDEVYSPFVEMAEFVQRTFVARRHHFYEEGLTSYLQAMRLRSPDRHSRFFALSAALMPHTDIGTSPIDREEFGRVLRRGAQCYRIPSFFDRRNVVIAAGGVPLGESEHPHAMFDPYDELAGKLIEKGYVVWLKGHPRRPREALQGAFQTSRLAQRGVRLLESDAPLLEIVLACNPHSIAAIVSVYSSVLVHAFTLFGIPAFSLHAGPVSASSARWKNIQDAIVPDVAELVEADFDDVQRVACEFHNRGLAAELDV
ncbi:hypothetical protein GIY62_05720 [Burkholderia plantarii]|uniref:polysialyltransferase family glycosyltransferase n=1 Tax=Burkholderia plantarii TaxID=41899 RepID=UPI00272C04EA|nr:polysialyltransferase family glycosyltransferase [Burkholderia plantarii]WLE60157.1 hypothetical protein GIY62_05720 [Burkholderia plantarii]